MDPATLTIFFKGVGMFLAIGAGIATVRYGYHLYKDGAGHGKDKIAFELGNISITASSVGSVVMSTAVLWGVIAINLSPSYLQNQDSVEVTSTQSIQNLKIPELISTPVLHPEQTLGNASELKSILAASHLAENETNWRVSGQHLTFGDATMRLSPDSSSYFRNEEGKAFVLVSLQRGDERARVVFSPTVNDFGQISFRPESVVVEPGQNDESRKK